jgi:hypothetical protein
MFADHVHDAVELLTALDAKEHAFNPAYHQLKRLTIAALELMGKDGNAMVSDFYQEKCEHSIVKGLCATCLDL